jgi:hypothetical protein
MSRCCSRFAQGWQAWDGDQVRFESGGGGHEQTVIAIARGMRSLVVTLNCRGARLRVPPPANRQNFAPAGRFHLAKATLGR